MSRRIHQGLKRVLVYPLALPTGYKFHRQPARDDGVNPDLPKTPEAIQGLYFSAVMQLRRLVERDGVNLDTALRTVVSENMMARAQINKFESEGRAHYAAQDHAHDNWRENRKPTAAE